MQWDEVKRIAKRAVKHLRSIREIPRYSQVINMTHMELNLFLQECPESPYFARDDWQTDEPGARSLVLAFVEKAKFGSYEPLHEATPSIEERKDSGSIVELECRE